VTLVAFAFAHFCYSDAEDLYYIAKNKNNLLQVHVTQGSSLSNHCNLWT